MNANLKKYGIAVLVLALICSLSFVIFASAKPAGAVNENIAMKDGASVRLDNPGIRFALTVEDGYVDSAVGAGGEYEGYTCSLGVAVLPTAFLSGGELTADGSYVYNEETVTPLVIDLVNAGGREGTKTLYNAVVTDIPAAAVEQALSARGFAKFTKDGSADAYVYTENTVSRSIGEVATAAYNDEQDAQVKAKLKTMLENSVGGGTISFDEQSYSVTADGGVPFTVFGNKYGFVLDSDFLTENNAVFASTNEAVAKIEGGNIVGYGDGETTVSVTVKGKTATAEVTVTGFTVTDQTGKFCWKHGQDVTVTHGDKVYTNTTLINGTPANPLTLTGYEVYTNNNFIEVAGTLELTAGQKLIEFAGTVINEAGNTTTEFMNFYVIRLTDVSDAAKYVDFSFYEDPKMSPDNPYLIFYGIQYKGAEMLDYTPMYGFQLGNSSAGVYNMPKLVYFGNNSFGYGDSAVTCDALAAALAADNFGANGVKMSVSSGTSGMMITSIASGAVLDATGKFEYTDDGVSSVQKTAKDGITGYEITAQSGAKFVYADEIELGKNWSEDIAAAAEDIVFSSLTPSALNQLVIRFTDVTDSSKGVAISFVNAACTVINWGATAATYIKSGDVANTFTGNFWEDCSPVSNDAVRLGSSTGKVMLRFNPAENKFYLNLAGDPTLYSIIGSISENPFSSENTGLRVKVSLEFIGNSAPASIFLTEIGGVSFTNT